MTPEPPTEPTAGPFTLPNALSAIRLAGSPFLVVLALADRADWCLALFIALWVTDWVDGKLAIRLRQRSPFGARLDSLADAAFYAAAVAAVGVLRWEIVRREIAWIVTAAASYLVSLAAALFKFRRVPAYHTHLAKLSWFLAGVAVIGLFAGWPDWLLRVAAAAVVVTNLEATAITAVLPGWRVDVPSVYHAARRE